MKYIVTRIAILVVAIIIIYYISNYIGERAAAEYGYMEATIVFFRLLLALVIVSLGVFSFEAYQFNKQRRLKERNGSIGLILFILLLVIILGGYYLGFAF